MKVKNPAILIIAGWSVLCAGLVRAQDAVEIPHSSNDAAQVLHQARDRKQERIRTGDSPLTAGQVRQNEQAQEQARQREQARIRMEKRLNGDQDAGNAYSSRGQGYHGSATSTRFGQGYESRMGGGQRARSGGAGGRR